MTSSPKPSSSSESWPAEQATATGEPAQQVQREAEHLQRDEHRQQVVRGGEHEHPQHDEEQERVHLGLLQAGTAGGVLTGRAGHRGGLRREAGLVVDPVADQQHRHHGEHEHHRHEEARDAVDRDGAARGDHVAGVPLPHEQPERDEQADGRQHHLRHAPATTGQERLEDDGDHGGAGDDEHRQRRQVVDLRGRDGTRRGGGGAEQGDHPSLPSATNSGSGSDIPVWSMVRSTAGVRMSRTGLG